jgi:hypothetical protein
MTQQAVPRAALRDGGGAGTIIVPGIAVRLAGAMLALAVAAVHVADQGGVTTLTSPHWIGWGYRLIEVGVPGDPGDVGNWGYWVGTVSLLVEVALVALSVSMLPALPRLAARTGHISHANPSGSVKDPASPPITMRCDPEPSGATPASLARARRL